MVENALLFLPNHYVMKNSMLQQMLFLLLIIWHPTKDSLSGNLAHVAKALLI